MRKSSIPHTRLLSSSELKRALIRERLRTDRTGISFSLLEFTLDGKEAAKGGVEQLGVILDERVRATDDKGYLSKNRIGAILPNTADVGANRLADDVCQQYLGQKENIVCRVFVYPTKDDSGNDQNGGEAVVGDGGTARGASSSLAAEPLSTLFSTPMPVWKRGLDIIGATIGLLLSAPFILVAAVLIKLTSPGPVFFAQRRAGRGGKPFTVYKLRTMYIDAEARKAELRKFSEQDGPAFKIKDDPRITKIGRYLRKACLDELPQLWNVLKGEMSLVGPRPLPCDEQAGCQAWQRRRLDVTPGLTCIWQVDGGRQVPFEEWMRMDIRYITGSGAWKDIKLIAKTALRVVAHRGT